MYEHTQKAKFVRWLLVACVIALFVTYVVVPVGPGAAVARPALSMSAVLLLIASIVFGSLTIRVEHGLLTWSFGPRLFQKSVPIGSITAMERTRTLVLEGWGIHLTPRGWLYNVSGRDAVWFRLEGGRQFMLGTDEPDELLSAINQVRGGLHGE